MSPRSESGSCSTAGGPSSCRSCNKGISSMARCIVCGSSSCHEIVRTPELPVLTNRLADTAAEARAVPRAALDLVHCAECQHIFNADFDASLLDYAEGYENALHFSPHFRGYLDQLVDRLIDSYPLAGKRAIEIG